MSHRARHFFIIAGVFGLAALFAASGCGQGSSRERAAGGIRGIVLTPEGEPSHGTPVFIEGLGEQARTGELGDFLFLGIPPGSYTVLADRPGYEPLRVRQVTVAAGKTTNIGRHELTRAGEGAAGEAGEGEPERASLFGHALLFGRVSHEGIVIRREDNPAQRATSDPDGGFFMDHLPADEVTLLFMAPGFATERVMLSLKPGLNEWRDDEAVLLMPRDGTPEDAELERTLAAREVEESELEAAPGMEGIVGRISLAFSPPTLRRLFANSSAVLQTEPLRYTGIDSEGRFVFAALGPGTYRLTLDSPALSLEEPVEVQVEEGQNTLVVLSPKVSAEALAGLPPAPGEGALQGGESAEGMATITGAVQLADPRRLITARIALLGTGFSTTPDQSGEFALTNVPPGTYEMSVTADKHKPFGPHVIAVSGNETIDVGRVVLELDVQFPRVVGITPPDGAIVSVDEIVPIRIEFDQDMDAESVRRSFGIEPPVSSRLAIGEGRGAAGSTRILVVELFGAQAEAPLLYGQRYTVTIGDSATNREGYPLEAPFRSSFETAPPELIDTYPRDGWDTEIVNENNPMVLYFNAPIYVQEEDDLKRGIRVTPSARGADPILRVFNDAGTGWGVVEVFYPFKLDTRYRVRIESRFRAYGEKRFANLPYTLNFKTPDFEWEVDPDAFQYQRPRGSRRPPR